MTKLNKCNCEQRQSENLQAANSNIVSVGSERFGCPEVLSQSSLVSKEAFGFQDTTFQSIRKSDVDNCKDPYANLVFSGGTTTFAELASALPRADSTGTI